MSKEPSLEIIITRENDFPNSASIKNSQEFDFPRKSEDSDQKDLLNTLHETASIDSKEKVEPSKVHKKAILNYFKTRNLA